MAHSGGRARLSSGWPLIYALLVAACLASLAGEDELSLGRNPVANLLKTAGEFARPSFLDVWFGNPKLEYRSDDGTVLRVENRQAVERDYLAGLGAGHLDDDSHRHPGLAARRAAGPAAGGADGAQPLAPRPLAWLAKGVLDVARSIHTLVFGLVLVGIVGLGPTAGILAIALHSMGSYGKLFAESIETLDMAAIDAVRSVGAGPAQVFFNAIWPAVLPQFVSSHLYVWEFNIRDSTILGIIGAGGLGLLIYRSDVAFPVGTAGDRADRRRRCWWPLSTRSAGASVKPCYDCCAILCHLPEVAGLWRRRPHAAGDRAS